MAGSWVRIGGVKDQPKPSPSSAEQAQAIPLQTGATSSASVSGYRALVLVSGEVALPGALLEAMQRRGMQPRVVGDLPAVMVAMAREPATVLVVVEAQHWAGLHELAKAMQRYYPKVRCWRYDAGDTTQAQASDERGGRLRAWSWEAMMHQPTIHVTVNQGKGDQQARDDEAVELPVGVGSKTSATPNREVAEPLLTREELDMLLDHSWERRRNQRRSRRHGDTEDGL